LEWKVCTRIYATIFAVQELSKELQLNQKLKAVLKVTGESNQLTNKLR
jgi:hypothetical protein